MVQIKSTAAVLVAAAVIAPAVAASFYTEDSLAAREDFDDYDAVFAREYDYELEERDFDDNELLVREPTRGWWRHSQGSAGNSAPAPAPASVDTREFDDEMEFEAREFNDEMDLDAREFDDEFEFEAREFDDDMQFEAREFDDEMQYEAREFDDEMELEAREPEADYEDLMQRYFDDLYERELAAEAEEFAARDYEGDDFDLVQRSPEPGFDFFGWIKNVFHPKKKDDKKADDKKATDDTKKSDDAAAPAADAAPVDAREWEEFDELD